MMTTRRVTSVTKCILEWEVIFQKEPARIGGKKLKEWSVLYGVDPYAITNVPSTP